MSHIDDETLALLAVLDRAPSDAERAHLASCARCRGELDDLRRVVDLGRSSRDVRLAAPSPAVWDRIGDELGLPSRSGRADPAPAGSAGPAVSGAASSRPAPAARRAAGRRRTTRIWVPVAAAAVVAALVLGFTTGRALVPDVPRASPAASAATPVSRAALVALPGWAGAHGTATLERGSGGRLSLVVDLDEPAPDSLREVWLMCADPARLVALGFLDGTSGTFAVPTGVDLARYPFVDVSAEPDDGDPAHSGDSVVRGQLEPGRTDDCG